MKKKLLSILLCLCMVVTLLPTVALATDQASSVVVGGAQLITGQYTTDGSEITTTKTGDSYAYFEVVSGTATLTLHNFTYSGAGADTGSYGNAAVYANGDLTIVLEGTNSLAQSVNSTIGSSGILCGNMSVQGTGSLAVSGGAATKDSCDSAGINCIDFKISGDATVTATGGAASGSSGNSYGIYCTDGGSATISGGTVNATGSDATGIGGYSYGICAKDSTISISGGTVTAKSTSTAGTKAAFNNAPTLAYAGGYQWNTNESAPDWTASTTTSYAYDASHTYVAIKPATPVMSVDFDGEGGNDPTLYTDFATGWNAAVAASTATVTLLANWTATGNGTNNSFGTGAGFGSGTTANSGYIRVPNGKIITLDLNGHDINRALTSPVDGSGNDLTATGGWVIGDFGTLTITDSSSHDVANQGKITGGYNSYEMFSAGGIFVGTSKSLTITGGNITGNKALNWGGGVYAHGRSTVTMTGGKISGNYANYDNTADDGGAGGVFTNGSFIMTGGEISENYACGTNVQGGGVYLNTTGTMTVGGKAVVKDNIAGATFASGSATGGSANNVYLADGKKITCGTGTAEKPVLDDGAYIGVTTATEPTDGNPVAITVSNDADYSTYFHSDNPSYAMQNTGEGLGQEVELALRSTTPTATTTTVAKTAATQASVDFTLTNTPAYADSQTWKVYSGSTGDTQASGVTVSNVGNTLTLAHASDIPAETYYVAVTETGKAESGRLALTVGAYAGNTVDYAMDFMQTHEKSWGAFNNHNFSTTDANGDGWSWDASEKTLTLSGLNFTTTARDAMYLPDDAKIVLQNGTTNTVKSVISGEENSIDSTGIHAAGKLEISGSGTLNVASGGVVSEGDNGSKSSIGIYGENDITISGAVTVNATGGTVTGNSNRNNGNSSYGVCSYSGTVSVTGSATVTATGGTVTASGDEYAMSCGVLADSGSFEVKGGTVTATGGTATAGNGSGESYGICSSGTTTISSGTVTATGGTASSNSLTAVNSNASYSYGISSGNTIISGGTVTAETTSTITAGQKSAFMDLPKLTGYASYQWRTASSGAYTPSTTTKYTDNANHSYVEIKPYTAPSSPSGNYTPPLVTEIKQGGSTTADNLSQLISGKKDLTVTGASGAKLVFDTAALKGIEAKTTGSVTVKIENVSKAHQEMEGKTVFSLTVMSGGKTLSDFGGSVTVSLPYVLKDGESAADVTVWYLAADGTMTEIPCTYDAKTGLATFTVTHFSEYVVGVSEWVNPFSDVKEADWFYDDAAFVAAKSLMSGTSATTFAPHANTSRGMIVTILYRLEGQPAVTGANPFDDVQSGKYYESAIIWAAQNGIVSGYGNGKFGPDDDITREQMAAILYNYAKYKGYDVTASADLSKFTDSGKLSGYAVTALSWANANGLVTGKGNGILDPQGNAERCQVAAILHRFCENVVK